MCKLEVQFSKFHVFRCLRANKRLAAQSTAYALRNWQGKHTFVKEKENWKKEIYWDILDKSFSQLMTSNYLKDAS